MELFIGGEKVNYGKLKQFDIANWKGVNTVIFFSGCGHSCPSCFNFELQDFNYGEPYTQEIEDKVVEYVSHPKVNGLCLLGGEPFQQDPNKLLALVKRVKATTGKEIVAWTGYQFEDLLKDINKRRILSYIDVLIDGKFDINKKNLMLKHRGSTNQRIINLTETLKSGIITLREE